MLDDMLHLDVDDDDEELTITVNTSSRNDRHHGNDNQDDQTDIFKNRCFNIFPSIFRRQYFKYKTNNNSNSTTSTIDKKHYSFDGGMVGDDMGSSSSSTVPFPITDKCLIPGSPISPRVKNFNLDMKILVLSRHDNPYLSRQIQRSNSLTSSAEYVGSGGCDNQQEQQSEYFVAEPPSTPILSHSSSRRSRLSSRSSYPASNPGSRRRYSGNNNHHHHHQSHHCSSTIFYEPEDQKNLHEQLVRSPPPHFPEKLSHFLFNESLISGIDQIDLHLPRNN